MQTYTLEEIAPSPLGKSWAKQMMWIFIVSDAIVFSSFLASYGFTRLSYSNWPSPMKIFNITLIAAMTFILISSSATMASAVKAAKENRTNSLVPFLILTMIGGIIFLGMQAYEWSHFIHQGARLFTNPWNVPHFSSFFFLITGFHGTHVFSGIIILLIVAIKTIIGKYSPEGIEIVGLYWHFVDLVWVFIFTLFYLL